MGEWEQCLQTAFRQRGRQDFANEMLIIMIMMGMMTMTIEQTLLQNEIYSSIFYFRKHKKLNFEMSEFHFEDFPLNFEFGGREKHKNVLNVFSNLFFVINSSTFYFVIFLP